MERIVIKDFSDIYKILDIIHDQWFNIKDIRNVNHILSIPFRKERKDKAEILQDFVLWKRIKIPVEEYLLKIHKVRDYDIQESENIGIYDFNTIEYEEDKGKLIINTGIPLKFEVIISGVEIIVERTGTTLDLKTKTKFL